MRDHFACGKAGDQAGCQRVAAVGAAKEIASGEQVACTRRVLDPAKRLGRAFVPDVPAADKGAIFTASDHGFADLSAKRFHGAGDIAVAKACRLVLIGEQDVDMVTDKPTERLAVPFGAPGVGEGQRHLNAVAGGKRRRMREDVRPGRRVKGGFARVPRPLTRRTGEAARGKA